MAGDIVARSMESYEVLLPALSPSIRFPTGTSTNLVVKVKLIINQLSQKTMISLQVF